MFVVRMLLQRSGREFDLLSGEKLKQRLTSARAALVSACSFAIEFILGQLPAQHKLFQQLGQLISAICKEIMGLKYILLGHINVLTIRGEVECGKSCSTGSRCTSVESKSVEANLAALVVYLFNILLASRLAEQVPVIAALSRSRNMIEMLKLERIRPGYFQHDKMCRIFSGSAAREDVR